MRDRETAAQARGIADGVATFEADAEVFDRARAGVAYVSFDGEVGSRRRRDHRWRECVDDHGGKPLVVGRRRAVRRAAGRRRCGRGSAQRRDDHHAENSEKNARTRDERGAQAPRTTDAQDVTHPRTQVAEDACAVAAAAPEADCPRDA